MFPCGMGMICRKVREQGLLYATLGSEGASVPVRANTSPSYCYTSENLLRKFARDPIVPSVPRDRDKPRILLRFANLTLAIRCEDIDNVSCCWKQRVAHCRGAGAHSRDLILPLLQS
jgi:hypothetical protein